jgi:SH3 domain protein
LFSLQANAQSSAEQNKGEPRFISDDLFTYIHAGPGLNYRIIGSVKAGTQVSLLKIDKESKFAQIVDDKNRSGWVDAKFINPTPSVRELVPGLQKQVSQIEQALQQARDNSGRLNQQIQSLNAEISQLKRQLSASEKAKDQVERKLENYDQTAQMQWFTRGGILAVISLIVGIVITYLPKKRRRNDNWM